VDIKLANTLETLTIKDLKDNIVRWRTGNSPSGGEILLMIVGTDT
jgi:hypothetical protein